MAIGADGVCAVQLGALTDSQVRDCRLVLLIQRRNIGRGSRHMVTEHLFQPNANRELANKVAYDMSLSPPRVAIPSLRAVLEYDFTEPLKEISVPIVAIDSDLGEPVNEARIRKVLPKFHATIITGVGHFLMMEDPARFNAALETEIQALRNPAGS